MCRRLVMDKAIQREIINLYPVYITYSINRKNFSKFKLRVRQYSDIPVTVTGANKEKEQLITPLRTVL